MKKIFKIKFFLFLIILTVQVFSQNPEIKDGYLIFRYNDMTATSVFLVISIDNYEKNFVFSRKDECWELRIPLYEPQYNLKPGIYKYKLVVDNIYINDPENPLYLTDPIIGKISYFSIEEPKIFFKYSPVRIKPLTYRFFYRNNSDWEEIKYIFITGSFNNWEPYKLKMNKINDNVWYIDIKFEKEGVFYYRYLINGNFEKDPLNHETVINSLNEVYSVINVK